MNPVPLRFSLLSVMRRSLRKRTARCLAALVCSLLSARGARAAVSLLLEQPYGHFTVAWNPTGHSALYFDHICAATPVKLRSCGPGELGVVISRYESIDPYDWIAVPLVPYLYAVGSPSEVPGTVDRLDVARLRDLYRREHLESVAPDTASGDAPQGDWYELVGSAYDRTIYGFRVKTTAEQDAMIIALFNDRPNVQQYSGARRNCADFVRVTVDRLYPHAIRRNYLADFGVSTPKSVARGLAHYARKHPEAGLEEFRIPQVPGDLPRSGGVEGVSEAFLKHYGVPMTLISPYITAAVLAAYVGQGRFAVPKSAPALDVAALEQAVRQAQAAGQGGAAPGAAAGAAASEGQAFTDGNWADFSGLSLGLPVLGNTTSAAFVSPADCADCSDVYLFQ